MIVVIGVTINAIGEEMVNTARVGSRVSDRSR